MNANPTYDEAVRLNPGPPLRRIETRCLFCHDRVRATGRDLLAERAARHLRNCTSFAAARKRVEIARGEQVDRDTEIATLLARAGMPIPAGLPAPRATAPATTTIETPKPQLVQP
jgi:hypothetical protein